MKTFDPTLELVACGSSHMPTCRPIPDWEARCSTSATTTSTTSRCTPTGRTTRRTTLNFLAKSVLLDRYIHTVGGIIDYVKAKKRSKHDVHISFDEWNVWYHQPQAGRQQRRRQGRGTGRKAPPLLEDVYNFEDVLLVGCALNTFIRRSDRVKVACIAQLVNVIAPIMTENGGPAWKQTIYYPLHFASLYGRGDALAVSVDGPTYDCRRRRRRSLSRRRRGARAPTARR